MSRALIILIGLLWALPAHAAEPWEHSTTVETDLQRIYGLPADEVSPRAAAALLLELVNAEREARGLRAVALSRAAGRLAREQADALADDGARGHYDSAGRKPELRYNRLGQTDHVAENLLFYDVQARVRLTPQLVRRMHGHWMESRGHAANILAPAHTHVGIGFALRWEGGSTTVAAVQEFVRDYGELDNLPLYAAVGERLSLSGRLDPGVDLSHIGIAWEPAPVSPEVKLGAEHLTYRQPSLQLALLTGTTAELAGVRLQPGAVALDSGSYGAEFYVPPEAAGQALYLTVWATNGSSAPFKAMTQVVLIDP